MSMSDCEKCWSTPCECGYKYKDASVEWLTIMRDMFDGLLPQREQRLGSSFFCRQDQTFMEGYERNIGETRERVVKWCNDNNIEVKSITEFDDKEYIIVWYVGR